MLLWFTNSIVALSMTVLLIVFLRKISYALALVDHPNDRKRHECVIPLCGGIAIFSAFSFVILSKGTGLLPTSFWAGIFVILCIGVMDDRKELSAATRLFAQLLAAGILIVPLAGSSIYVANMLPLAFVDTSAPILMIIAILFVVGLVNSWNMIDGVDGLAGGCAAFSLFWIALTASWKGLANLDLSCFVLLAAVCGFLLFNMRSRWLARANIFLGDAGSTALGATIAYLLITLSREGEIAFPVLLWIVIVPVTDTISLIVRRLYSGRNPLTADRWHLHHLLLDQAYSHSTTTNIIVASSALCGGIGFIGLIVGVPNYAMTFGLLFPVAIHSAFVFAATGFPSHDKPHPVKIPQFNPIAPMLLRPELDKSFVASQQPVQPSPNILSDAV
ncbi:MraY family glycosyltransferase [Phyllobacterium myrsinacearum]|uniref:UDP-GlcNAc:undecaprenyl-phosphate GlcNAc-1-phosphate transferase n=1 Tax=Phyllobacterium myrsinacearum TaxID=28101 RepID=A0A839EKU0_9HYPH|nr:UDP-GlcNAc:undecaprenyl-phosphate GlcNAc-1-phosphate transferase [Phyllobacterium myrsinacearum]